MTAVTLKIILSLIGEDPLGVLGGGGGGGALAVVFTVFSIRFALGHESAVADREFVRGGGVIALSAFSVVEVDEVVHHHTPSQTGWWNALTVEEIGVIR